MARYDESVVDAFDRASERNPDRPSLIYLGQEFSYGDLRELVDRFATALYELGVRSGDMVVIYLPNCPQWVVGYYGAMRIGAIPVPISPIYTPYEIAYLINDSGAQSILCLDTNFGYVQEVFAKTCLKRIIVTSYVDLVPLWKRLIGWLFDKIPNGRVERGAAVHFFKDLIHTYPPRPPKVRISASDHLAYLLYTGGTTGFPKGCPTTHIGMVSTVSDVCAVTEGYVSEGEDVLIMAAPLFHQFGQVMCVAVGLSRGNPTVLLPMPEIDSILASIERFKGTLFLGVPALYRMILENDRLDQFDLRSLKYCWSGGDVLPSEVYKRWKHIVRVPIYQGYGSTEVGFISMSPLGSEPEIGSIGRPLNTRAVRIAHPETLGPVAANETGELLVTSKYISGAYWKKPEETAASYVELDGRIWYKTKDYCRMDGDGSLWYVDRSSDIIKYKGYRVSCSEIEAVLQDHPAVIASCVVGVPDSNVGERIKAMVVLKEDARGVNASQLVSWCRQRLAPYKIPKYIEFRDMLPKSKVGKLLRREVREQERRRVTKKGAVGE